MEYSTWTDDEMAELRRIIQLYAGKNVRWDLHQHRFNHPLGSIKVVASRIRTKMQKRRERDTNQQIRDAIQAARKPEPVRAERSVPQIKGTPATSKGKWHPRVEWTREQIDYMHHVIVTAMYRKQRVTWRRHAHNLGHPLHACRAKAADIRSQLYHQQDQARAQAVVRKVFVPPPTPKQSYEGHCVVAATQSLAFTVEMRNRIEGRTITAGLLGDPPKGRSALDERRGIEPEPYRGKRHKAHKAPPDRTRAVPSLATRPMQF